MKYTYLEQPCRNFCILASVLIIDPLDNREKLVLSTFVSGGTGRLIFIDTLDKSGESVELPSDEGAWALLCLDNKKLLVGTCGLEGYLHCLDLKSRKWLKSLRDENETYIWNLVKGSDNMIYGGTYPGCSLLRYDPKEHVLKNLGRVSDNPDNMYSREVFGQVPGKIYISCAMIDRHGSVWDINDGTWKRFGPDGSEIKKVTRDYIYMKANGRKFLYDPYSLKEIDADLPGIDLSETIKDPRLPDNAGVMKVLSNGSIAGVRGQEYFVLKKDDEKAFLERIPVEAPPTRILALISTPSGELWGSSNFGQTIFRYDPRDNRFWNSAAVCNRGGEVYSMQCIEGKIFMAAYAGGDHIVYDPSESWDQINNINPVTLKPVGPDLIRPHGRSIIGPDGSFWTGWTAKYGTYGGGISRVDAKTHEVTSWYDPIPEQEIGWLASDDKYLYFTTSGFGNGLPVKSGPFYMGVMDTAGNLIYKHKFEENVIPKIICITGEYGVVNTNSSLRIFNCSHMEFVNEIELKNPASCIIKYDEDMALVFYSNELMCIKPSTGEFKIISDLPSEVNVACKGIEGEIFFAVKSKLYRMEKLLL